jgi:hypothetical protein
MVSAAAVDADNTTTVEDKDEGANFGFSELPLRDPVSDLYSSPTESGRSPARTSLRSFISRCVASHDRCHTWLLDRQLAEGLEILLIDVKSRRIARASLDNPPAYLILSYVWGNVPQLQTTISNLAELQEPGALRSADAMAKIPRVIQDAMSVTELLGEQYLWVDSLCICQDDPKSKHEQIQSMGFIYSGALATIIPITGQDASVGLPGLISNKESFYYQPESSVKAVGLGLALEGSVYNTRGWTFQERILSKRCIFYHHTGIGFACRQNFELHGMSRGVELDDMSSDHIPTRISLLNPFLLLDGDRSYSNSYIRGLSQPSPYGRPSDQILEIYINIIGQYTEKKLSFSEDILSAFAGISGVFQHVFRCPILFGLPENFLFYALLWTPSGGFSEGQSRRNICPSNNSSNALYLPSWSWAGWEGPVNYSILPLYSFSYHAATTPALHHILPYIREIRMVERDEKTPNSRRLVWTERSADELQDIRNRTPRQRVNGDPRFSAAVEINCNSSSSINNTCYLQFHANATSFHQFSCDVFGNVTVEHRGPTRDLFYYHRVAWLAGKDGERCGLLYGVTNKYLAMSVGETRDLIWLGRTNFLPIKMRYWPISSKLDHQQSTRSYVCIMLIVWKGNVAERIAVGHMYENSLLEAGSTEKLILLA